MDLRFEHLFWLNMLKDHLFKIELALPHYETELIDEIVSLKTEAHEMLEIINENKNIEDALLELTDDIHEYQLKVLRAVIMGKMEAHLLPMSLNLMINKTEEYIRVLYDQNMSKYKKILSNPTPRSHPLHHHILWLPGLINFLCGLMCHLDGSETDLKREIKKAKKEYIGFQLKAGEYVGILRTGETNFPALQSLNETAANRTIELIRWLNDLMVLRSNKIVLGSVQPWMIDHVIRECCYYILGITRSNDSGLRKRAITRDAAVWAEIKQQ